MPQIASDAVGSYIYVWCCIRYFIKKIYLLIQILLEGNIYLLIENYESIKLNKKFNVTMISLGKQNIKKKKNENKRKKKFLMTIITTIKRWKNISSLLRVVLSPNVSFKHCLQERMSFPKISGNLERWINFSKPKSHLFSYKT